MLWLLLACTGEEPVATLTDVQEQVFTPSCAFSSCHGTEGGGASDLDLTEGMAWLELVGVAAVDAPDEILVVPGDAAGSYLVKKCAAEAGIVGEPMPDGDADGLDVERLQLLRDWIDAGAADD